MCKYSINIYTKALLSREAELRRAQPFWLLFSSEMQKKGLLVMYLKHTLTLLMSVTWTAGHKMAALVVVLS